MTGSFRIKTDTITPNMRKLVDETPKRMADAVGAEVKIIAQEARRRTPVLTGMLRATVKATEPVINGKKVSASIVAGGPLADYAVYVHEDLDAHHATGEAKFVERPLFEAAGTIGRRIATRLEIGKIL